MAVWACIYMFIGLGAAGQTGGTEIFQLLTVPYSAAVGGLGGVNVTHLGRSPLLTWNNPALVTDSTQGRLAVALVPGPAGTLLSQAAYSHRLPRQVGYVYGGVLAASYGQLTRTDALGTEQGTFNAGEVALYAGIGRVLGRNVSVGGHFTLINSTLAEAQAWGLAVSFGGIWRWAARDLTVGLALRNLGTTLSNYGGLTNAELPFRAEAGVRYRLPRSPLRLTLTLQHLQTPDLRTPDEEGNPPTDAENALRHVVPGLELLLGQALEVRAGYNVLRRRTLTVPDQPLGLPGLGLGMGLKLDRLALNVALGGVAPGATQFHLDATFRLSQRASL